MDSLKTIEEALDVLSKIAKEYPKDEVGLWAGPMSLAVRPDIQNMVTKNFPADRKAAVLKRERELEKVPAQFVEAAEKAVAKKSPTYKTPVFKCLEHFDKCTKHRAHGKHVCRAPFGHIDVAPKIYPTLSSPWLLGLPVWAVEATGAGAEPSI